MTNTHPDVPSYKELLERTDAPAGSSWGLFGPDDQVGTLNFQTPDRIIEAARLVKRGKLFNLDYALNAFDPYPFPLRKNPVHHMFQSNSNHRDDYLDGFYLQGTSQIDGLRHMRNPKNGFYNFAPDEEIGEYLPRIGMNNFAERGIAGRGVLLDVLRYFEGIGKPIGAHDTHRLSPAELDAIAAAQGVEFKPGDILLIRTGWADYYINQMTKEERIEHGELGGSPAPGLAQTHAILEWLWDHEFSLVASDNPGVEAGPVLREESEFVDPDEPPPDRGFDHNGMLHRPIVALLGFIIGELWYLEDLAADCAAEGVYEFLLTASPLNVVGGVGSPPNAIAIK